MRSFTWDLLKWGEEMDMIEDLVALSHDPSPDKRRQLLRGVADMFLDDIETYTDRSLVLFTDVLTDLLKQVDETTRAEIAERLSDAPNAGEALHLFLAYDDPDVAGPVLRNSRVLSDEALVDIAETKGQAHRLAIAMRDHLTETVTDTLISKGESPGSEGSDEQLRRGDFGQLLHEAGRPCQVRRRSAGRDVVPRRHAATGGRQRPQSDAGRRADPAWRPSGGRSRRG